jgi:hypothetical protein
VKDWTARQFRVLGAAREGVAASCYFPSDVVLGFGCGGAGGLANDGAPAVSPRSGLTTITRGPPGFLAIVRTSNRRDRDRC